MLLQNFNFEDSHSLGTWASPCLCHVVIQRDDMLLSDGAAFKKRGHHHLGSHIQSLHQSSSNYLLHTTMYLASGLQFVWGMVLFQFTLTYTAALPSASPQPGLVSRLPPTLVIRDSQFCFSRLRRLSEVLFNFAASPIPSFGLDRCP